MSFAFLAVTRDVLVTRATPMYYVHLQQGLQIETARKLFSQLFKVLIMPLVIYALGGGHADAQAY